MTRPRSRTLLAVVLSLTAALLAGAVVVGYLYAGREDEPAAVGAPIPTGTPPLYTVVTTRPATADDGTTVTLVVASASLARTAVDQYLRLRTGEQKYLFVEALDRADADRWLCAGEFVPAESEMRYAIFPRTKASASFPVLWVECR